MKADGRRQIVLHRPERLAQRGKHGTHTDEHHVRRREELSASAVAGVGVVCMPWFLARQPLAEGALRRVLPEYRSATASIYLVYPTSRHLSAAVRALRDFLVERYGQLEQVAG